MPETEKGPLLTDETFFHSCLDLNRPEMREVRHFAENHDYGQARSALAASLRSGLAARRERFLQSRMRNRRTSINIRARRMRRHVSVCESTS